jgi:hypothetical protein
MKDRYSTRRRTWDTCKEQKDADAGTANMRLPQSLSYTRTQKEAERSTPGQFPRLQRVDPPQAGYS